jgi:hypothetical protein
MTFITWWSWLYVNLWAVVPFGAIPCKYGC